MFGVFSLFWTTVPQLLVGPDFGLTQKGVAIFALAGVAGAIAAPIASWIAEDWISGATAVAMIMAIAAFAMTHIAPLGSNQALALLVLAGIILDFAVSANLVLGQRLIFALAPEYRARMNAIYMTTFFCGGAIGSGLGGMDLRTLRMERSISGWDCFWYCFWYCRPAVLHYGKLAWKKNIHDMSLQQHDVVK